jgi:lauroyl/myristoyl acyltransferase
MGVPQPGWNAWMAFRRFGAVSIDGIRARGEDAPRWEVRGKEHLDAAMASGLPVVLWTAHMGSYDAAAAFFAERIGKRMHAVRRPERNPRMQALREKNFRDMENPHYTTIYNDSREDGLALELMRVLKAGQWVALQADRALPGLSTFVVEEGDLEWTLPKGPFFLPCAARALCLPVFVHRAGPRSHEVTIHPAVTPRASRDHQAVTMELARSWARLLRHQVGRFPDQWFVFERMVRPTTCSEA